jgi:hypothetical protein
MSAPLCATEATPDLWYSDNPTDQNRAKAICARCNAARACSDAARALGDPHGIWAGQTAAERLSGPTAWIRPTAYPAEHNRARYIAGECDCPTCKRAHANYMTEWRRRRAESHTSTRLIPEELGEPDGQLTIEWGAA